MHRIARHGGRRRTGNSKRHWNRLGPMWTLPSADPEVDSGWQFDWSPLHLHQVFSIKKNYKIKKEINGNCVVWVQFHLDVGLVEFLLVHDWIVNRFDNFLHIATVQGQLPGQILHLQSIHCSPTPNLIQLDIEQPLQSF